MMKKSFVLYTMILLSVVVAKAQDVSRVFQKKTFVEESDTLQYRILFPRNFDENKHYPLVLFLHGAGERGSDNERQLIHGASLFASENTREKYPAIVVFPQCPTDDYWANIEADRNVHPYKFTFFDDAPATKSLSLVMKMMDDMASRSFVDRNRIYVGGLSMGGMGTFEILARKPEFFAAGFAICGGVHPNMARKFATSTPVWIFHGAKDDVVQPIYSLKVVETILAEGGHPNYTLYANDNHNSWDSAFAEPKLLNWLFSNTRQ